MGPYAKGSSGFVGFKVLGLKLRLCRGLLWDHYGFLNIGDFTRRLWLGFGAVEVCVILEDPIVLEVMAFPSNYLRVTSRNNEGPMG